LKCQVRDGAGDGRRQPAKGLSGLEKTIRCYG
jgi:hypothetical protein